MKKRFMATLCLLLPLLAACGDDGGDTNAAGSGDEDIIIGMPIARTGFFSDFDGPVAVGAQLEIDAVNAEGGVNGRQLRLVYADTKSDPELIQPAAIEVLDKGADVIITSCDYDLGGPAARVANQRGILAMGCASSPKYGVQGIGPTAFNTSSGTPTETAVMAQFAFEKGFRKAYMLKDESLDYTKSTCEFFERSFTALAGKDAIVGRDTFQNEDPSVAAQVTRLESQPEADFIVLCSYPPGGATAMRQIRARGVDLPIVTSDAFDGEFWLKGVPDASNIYHSAPGSLFGDDPEAEINEFFDSYEDETGDPAPSGFGLYGAVAVQMLVKAVEETDGTDGVELSNAIEEFEKEALILGSTTYTDSCHSPVGRELRMMEIQEGKTSFVEVIKPKKLPKVNC